MDNSLGSSIFSFQQLDDDFINFEVPPANIDRRQKEIHKDLVMDLTVDNTKKRPVAVTIGDEGKENSSGSFNGEKRKREIIHREIEKQRRQEMAKLYASIRSLLPLQFIKGTRSISDHLQQALNYITGMQKNIKELNSKRDKLKEISSYSGTLIESNDSSCSSINQLPNTAMVRLSEGGGVEILINSGWIEKKISLSSVLMALQLEEGLDVISCISTKVNERFHHTVHSEIIDPNCIDLPTLQQKFTDLVNTPSNFW